MNQILVTKKLYVTPELKRKKKIYKFDFILSIFLVIVLISLYIYAEYDRNKSEEVSKDILANMNLTEDTTVAKSDVLIAILNEDNNKESESTTPQQPVVQQPTTTNKSQTTQQQPKQMTVGGYTYTIDSKITIPSIGVEYPVFLGTTGSAQEIETLLKNSPTKFHGSTPNEVGNYCIVGHNYRNTKFFSKVPTLKNGDRIQVTDMSGRTINYSVYDKYIVVPEDTNCTSQLTNGKKEVTLITCTDDSKQRVIVKAREVL